MQPWQHGAAKPFQPADVLLHHHHGHCGAIAGNEMENEKMRRSLRREKREGDEISEDRSPCLIVKYMRGKHGSLALAA
jgi:hypothetical protein